MQQRRLKITFSSDWHIGSGAGIPGSIDRQVLRDADGFPYVPGKTLTGVLRDAAEWIADIRQEHDDARCWRGVLTSLFGEQPKDKLIEARGAAIGISSAELTDDVRAILNDRKFEDLGLKQALFTARAGVTIDRTTGRSEDGKLFSMERARGDCELTAYITALRELSDDEHKLLDDAVKAVRRIGGKRRRGAGCCSLEWLGDWQEACLGKDVGDVKMFAGDGDVIIGVRLKTLQPLIINKITLGNEVKSDSVVPGTSLLPYFANEVFKAVDKDFMRKCVMNGDISVSTLLPEFGGLKSLPAPLCLAEVKESGDKVNRMVSPHCYDGSGKPIQMKDIRSGFITVEDGVMTHHGAVGSKVVRTHNTIEDDSQRPTSDVGGLFTYEAIGADSCFMGTLRISKRLADKIRKLPEVERGEIAGRLAHDIHSFGRSRKDEYGTCELRCSAGSGDNEWSSCKLIDGRDGKYLVVLLRSELLIRGKSGAWSVSLEDVRELLERRLGVSLSDDDSDWSDDGNGGKVSPIGGTRGHSIRIDRRESWHSGWGLPRPSLLCFKAGSIFMFKVTNPDRWDEGKAEALARDGLGERGAEGYGQLLINPTFLFNKEVCPEAEQKHGADGPDKASHSTEVPELIKSLAETALMRRFRATARREAFRIVADKEPQAPFDNFKDVEWEQKRKEDKTSTSQFGALREAAASIEAIGNTEIFKRWAISLEKRDTDRNKWKAPWIKMFNQLAEKPYLVWDMLSALRELKSNFLPLLPSIGSDPKFMGIFFDLLCEAVFDEAKPTQNARGGESE